MSQFDTDLAFMVRDVFSTSFTYQGAAYYGVWDQSEHGGDDHIGGYVKEGLRPFRMETSAAATVPDFVLVTIEGVPYKIRQRYLDQQQPDGRTTVLWLVPGT